MKNVYFGQLNYLLVHKMYFKNTRNLKFSPIISEAKVCMDCEYILTNFGL